MHLSTQTVRSDTSSLRLILPILTAVCILFWIAVYLIEQFDWDQGIGRAWITILVLVSVPSLIGIGKSKKTDLSWKLSLISLGILNSIIILNFIDLLQDHRNPLKYGLVLLIILVGLGIHSLLWKTHILNRERVSLTIPLLFISGCTVYLIFHLISFARGFANPTVIDVGTTTLSAAKALWAGENPYTLPIDVDLNRPPNELIYQGYKYFPMMAITYLPLSWMGDRGILTTNLLLDLLTVGLIFLLAYRIGGDRNTGLFACLLYLMLPLIPNEIFGKGVTDLAAVVPLLAGLLYCREKAGLSGFLIGLSVAMKLLPGLLFIPFCLPFHRRWRYVTGVCIGLLPVLIFLAASPIGLIGNTFFFNAQRSIDSTSWLFGLPTEIGSLARAICIVLLIGIALYTWFKQPTQLQRCAFGVIAILGVLLSGPINHRNYQLWWIPIFTVILGVTIFRSLTINSGPNLQPIQQEVQALQRSGNS